MNDFVSAHLSFWQEVEIIPKTILDRFLADTATQEDMDRLVEAMEKIKGMTTADMVKSLEKHDVHPSGSAARTIVGGMLTELTIARDYALVYNGLKVKGKRDVNEILRARERLKGEGGYKTAEDEFQREKQ